MKQYFTTAFWITFFGASTLTASGYVALFTISFTESCCFIIPPDFLLPAIVFNKTLGMVVFITLFTSFASVAGAVFGYFIGMRGGQPLLHRLFRREKTDKVERMFQKYDVWAIGIAAFTPIPYKVFTISAGVFNLHFIRFLLVSSVARTTRYMLIAIISYYFFKMLGMTPEDVEVFLHSMQFKLITVGIATGVILFYIIYRIIRSRGKSSVEFAGPDKAA